MIIFLKIKSKVCLLYNKYILVKLTSERTCQKNAKDEQQKHTRTPTETQDEKKTQTTTTKRTTTSAQSRTKNKFIIEPRKDKKPIISQHASTGIERSQAKNDQPEILNLQNCLNINERLH